MERIGGEQHVDKFFARCEILTFYSVFEGDFLFYKIEFTLEVDLEMTFLSFSFQ